MPKTIITLLVMLAACGPSGVNLNNPPSASERAETYLWSFSATTLLDSPQEITTRRTSLEATVTMKRSRAATGGQASITIDPSRFTDDGLVTRDLRPVTLVYSIDASGNTRAVSGATSYAGQATMGALTAILGQEFASLIDFEAEIGDEWRSPLKLSSDDERLDLDGQSRLEGFEVSSRRRAAVVATTRSGAAYIKQKIGRANAELDGQIEQRLRSIIDIDTGALLVSDTRSTARFEISISSAKQGIVSVTQRSLLRAANYSSL